MEEIKFSIRFFNFIFGVFFPSILFFTECAHINLTEIIDLKIGDVYMSNEEFEKAINHLKDELILIFNNI